MDFDEHFARVERMANRVNRFWWVGVLVWLLFAGLGLTALALGVMWLWKHV